MPEIQGTLLKPMMSHAYAIRNWNEHFETASSRQRVGAMGWVGIPTKHDGRGFRRVTRLRNANHVLLGWYMILQVAAKMPCRGLLADFDGPLDARDLSDKTGIEEKVFEAALTELVKEDIGWIERIKWVPKAGFWETVVDAYQLPPYHGRQQDRARGNGRQREATVGNKKQTSPGELIGNGRPQEATVDNATEREATVGNGRPQAQTVQYSTDSPPTVPQKGDRMDFDEAVVFLDAAFKRKKRAWSQEERELLWAIIRTNGGIDREDARLIQLWYGLPGDHEVFQKVNDRESTRRKQELTTLLREFNGELDKIHRFAPLFDAAGPAPKKKEEPPRWREFFNWIYPDAETINFPDRYEDLAKDLREQYEKRYPEFEEATKK